MELALSIELQQKMTNIYRWLNLLQIVPLHGEEPVTQLDLLVKARIWFDFVLASLMPSKNISHNSMKATILVAHLIHVNENKIVVEQLKQAVQNSMGSMPFPVLISYYACEWVVHVFKRWIDLFELSARSPWTTTLTSMHRWFKKRRTTSLAFGRFTTSVTRTSTAHYNNNTIVINWPSWWWLCHLSFIELSRNPWNRVAKRWVEFVKRWTF